MFTIIGWIIFGFIAGLIARAVMPGDQPLSFLKTTILGVIGAVVGGVLGSLIFDHQLPEFNTDVSFGFKSFFSAVVGGVIVLFAYTKLINR